MKDRIIKCCVIDDEPHAITLLEDHILKIPYLNHLASFTSPLEAIAFLEKNNIDLLFLDINMPELSGLQLLEVLPHPPKCVLTTAYSEYALSGYELNVIDYLLKPIEFDRFLKACNKVLSEYRPFREENIAKSELIRIKSGSKYFQFKLSEIVYIEASGNYLTFHSMNEKVMTLMNMEDAEGILPKASFLRVHRSFIVNIHFIKVVENHQIKILNTNIPISKSYRKSFTEAFLSN